MQTRFIMDCGFRLCLRFISGLLLVLFHLGVSAQKHIGLEELRKLVLENNSEVKAADERALTATLLRKASFTRFLPSFDFNAQYLHIPSPFQLLSEDLFLPVVPQSAIDMQTGTVNPFQLLTADPPALVFGPDGLPMTGPDGNFLFRQYAWVPQSAGSIGQKNNVLFHFGLSQPLFTGGKVKAQYKAALSMERAARHSGRISLDQAIADADTLFWSLLVLQEKEKLARQYIQMLETLSQDMQNYLEEGLITRNEKLQVQIAFHEAQLELTKAENGIRQLSMAICRLAGLSLGQELVAVEEISPYMKVHDLEQLWEEGLQNRPELGVLREKVHVASSLAAMARGGRLPDLALGAGLVSANPNPWNGLQQEFGLDWFVGLTLTVPVYHWGERRHLHRAARHEVNQTQLTLEDTRNLIRIDIAGAFYDYDEARKNLTIRQLSLEQALENLEMVKHEFEEGMVRAVTLMEAQTFWHQAHTDYIESKAAIRISATKLKRSIGR